MPDILKVTTPLPGQENSNRVRPDAPQQQQQVQTVTDPTRVTQPNAQDVYTEREAGKFLPNYESNYEMFLQMLRLSPDMMEEFSTLFFSRTGQLVASGLEEGMAGEIAQFMEMLQMDEPQLLQFVKKQLSGSVKFEGPLFDVLRQAVAQSSSPALREAVANFLKSYDSLSSSQHILNELLQNLDSMATHMPKSLGDGLKQLAETLLKQHPNGQNSQNLATIRGSILPYLSNYIHTRHDYGPVRDFITMFVLNLTRYEMGSMEQFSQNLREMLAFKDIQARLPGIEAEALERALAASVRDDNALADKLVSIISRGMGGEGGMQAKPLFENILRAMLVNESVYMPLLHAMIPADVDGSQFFSEIWVDPDADEGYEKESYERAIKMLVKFDIKDVGFFELILLNKGDTLDVQLFSPAHLMPFKSQISGAIKDIAARNELRIGSLLQEAAAQPKLISEVFPKLYERKNAINVVV